MKHTVSLKKNSDFRRAYARGRSFAHRDLVVYFRRNHLQVNRVGITVSAKLGGAVTRNLVRRRVKEFYRTHEQLFKIGFDIVFVARGRTTQASYNEIGNAVLFLSKKLGLLNDEKSSD